MIGKNVFGQPKGLFLLFFTELWERFGFYALQSIVVLYMTQSFHFTDERSYLLYGAFSSLIYFTPVLGGYIADHFIGFRQSVIIGGFLFILGYVFTSFPNEKTFFLGLSIVTLANGFFKPCVSSIVGDLYSKDDPKRDSGFTIFYMGINIGSLIPPIFIGTIVKHFGWHWGFLLAAIGMSFGVITFLVGKKRLGNAGNIPEISPIQQNRWKRSTFYLFLASGLLMLIFLLHLIFYFPKQADMILITASLSILIYFIRVLFRERPDERHRLIVCWILMLIALIFWAFYSQIFTSIMLFASRNMDKQIFGIPIDAAFTPFFSPFFIITLSPILSWLWVRLDQKKINPSTPMKFASAILFVAIGYFLLTIGTTFFSPMGMTSSWWIFGYYFFQTIGELFLSPIGLAMITRIAPSNLVGMLMGIWFLMLSTGFLVGSFLSTLADVPKDASIDVSLTIYSHTFLLFGILAVILAIGCMLLIPYLKRSLRSSSI